MSNINFKEHEDRLAIIFKKSLNEKYEIDVATLVDYNTNTGEYSVIAGDYEGYDENNFSKINGDYKFIFGKGINLQAESSKEPYIYIFDPEDIKALAENKGYTIEQTYSFIVNKANSILLMNVGGYDFKSFFCKKTRIVPFSPEAISNMLEGYISKQGIEKYAITPVQVSEVNMRSATDDKNKELEKILQEFRTKAEEKKEKTNINVVELIESINKKIIGQEEAIKTLAANIYFNQKLIDVLEKEGKIDKGELDARKISILLDGSTGTGKTAIVKEIADSLSLPMEIVNANSFSETGYVGPTITDVLSKLLKKANGDVDLAERGIIVFDEIDKIAANAGWNGKDMKQGVQEELLGFLSGGIYDISEGSNLLSKSTPFDTSKLTFILSGAFTSIKDKKIKEQGTSTIGFSGSENEKKKEYEVTPQDYIDYGLMREFFGRVKVLSSTKSYEKEDLKKILLESTISPLRNFEKTVQMFGYSGISYDDEFLDSICEEAYGMNTGARALQTIISGIQNKMLLDLTTQKYDLSQPITLTKQSLEEFKQGNKRSY